MQAEAPPIEAEDQSVLLAAALAAVALLYEFERLAAASKTARPTAWRSAARGGERWGTAERGAWPS